MTAGLDSIEADAGGVVDGSGRAEPPAALPWRVLGVALLAQFGLSVLDQGVPLLTGFIKTDLDLSATVAGLAVSSFAWGKILGAYAAGVAADAIGEHRVILAGGVAAAVLVWLALPAPLPLVFVLLGAAGMASATSTPAGGRLVLNAFPRHRTGFALGIRQTGIPLGALVSAALLPWIADAAGWRWALATAGLFAALLVLPVAITKASPPLVRPSASVRRHARIERDVALLIAWGCLFVTGQYAILAFLALDLHAGAGLTLAEASIFVAVVQVAGIAGRAFWGAVSDRALVHGRKWVLVTLTGLGVASALTLAATPRSAPIWALVLATAFAGVALVGYQGHWVTMVAETAGRERVGAVTGLAVTFVLVAVALTPPMFGLVADVADTYRAIWVVLAAVLALAFVPALLVRERVA